MLPRVLIYEDKSSSRNHCTGESPNVSEHKKFGSRPNVIDEVGLHGRGHPERFMDSAKIVVSEVQADRIPQVFPLLAKAQC
jgi:hypothetical protein